MQRPQRAEGEGGLTARRPVMLLCVLSGLSLLAASCTGAAGPKPNPSPSGSPRAVGGTLHVGILIHVPGTGAVTSCEFTFCGGGHDDPQWSEGDSLTEVLRCCLVRTLLSYNGQPTGEGGTVLRPDVATELPTVSSDGLTWTFHLKHGLRYGPPLQDVTITSPDFIRSIERLLGPPPSNAPDYYGGVLDPYLGNYLALADLIAGGRDYVDQKAQHITGLEAPDPYTLRIHLTRPDGALPSLLSEPDVAPIPPNPFDPAARFGVLDRHSRPAMGYLVASGPYMIEGADKLDLSKPADQQSPAAGDAPDSLTLVRNPSWQPSTDPLRPAYLDRIVFTPVATVDDATRLVRSGAMDLVMNWDATPAELAGGPPQGTSIYPSTLDWIILIELNTAMAPLDDVHVRLAVNYAVARDPVVSAFEKVDRPAVPATKLGLDSEEDNLLLNFDPYHAAQGDLSLARQEMAQSAYDADHDGRCDAAACTGVRLVVRSDFPGYAEAAHIVADDLKAIGIDVRVDEGTRDTLPPYGDPTTHVAMRFTEWIKDLDSGSTYFPQLLGSPKTGLTDQYGGDTLLGSSPAQLRKWGYQATSVPDLDGQIEACLPLSFEAQARCWAQLDQYATTEVVPWIPLLSLTSGRVVSSRVAGFAFDQSPPIPLPSLDRISLRPGVSPPPSPVPTFGFPAIPGGTYQVTVTKDDLLTFDPRYDPGGIDENTGTLTIRIHDGVFEWIQNADHPVYNPISTGIYRGSGDQVTFDVQRPDFNAITLPTERWTFDGTSLHFHLVSCGNLEQIDPHNPYVCGDFRVVFEAHPWVKVG